MIRRFVDSSSILEVFLKYIEGMVQYSSPDLSTSSPFGDGMLRCAEAQSIGEPATQMTLKTFHFAGVVGLPWIIWIWI